MSMISELVEELIDNADLHTKELHDLMYRAANTIGILSEKVREPKQGEWIKDKRQDVLLKAFIDKGEEWRVCSVCGTGYKIGERTNGHYHAYFRNYCPNCGARMKGADNE